MQLQRGSMSVWPAVKEPQDSSLTTTSSRNSRNGEYVVLSKTPSAQRGGKTRHSLTRLMPTAISSLKNRHRTDLISNARIQDVPSASCGFKKLSRPEILTPAAKHITQAAERSSYATLVGMDWFFSLFKNGSADGGSDDAPLSRRYLATETTSEIEPVASPKDKSSAIAWSMTSRRVTRQL